MSWRLRLLGMRKFVIRCLVNAGALYVAAVLVPGIHLEGVGTIILVALLFGVINAIIRPLVLAVTCLINVLTLGLFTLVVNAAMFLLTSLAAGVLCLDFRVEGFVAAFLGALVVSAASFVLTRLLD